MFNKKVAAYPLWAWVVVALSAPLAHLASQGPWISVLIIAVVCGAVCWGIQAMSDEIPKQKPWFCITQLIWLSVISGEIARMSADCWPTGSSFPVVPLTLLILAGFSAWDGAARASRVGGVLFWFIAILYGIVLGAGVKDLRFEWIAPTMGMPNLLLVSIFLLPAVTSFIPREKGKASAYAIIIISVFAVVISLWTVGNLSDPVAQALTNPFYEFSKSLSLFGVAERFESVISVALTLGYFAIHSLLFSAAGHLASLLHDGWGRGGIVISGSIAIAILLYCPVISSVWLATLSVIFWGIIPLIYYGIGKIKKSKKTENNA